MIRIAKTTVVTIEIAKIIDMSVRLSAMPIVAQMTTSPNSKSRRFDMISTDSTRATMITHEAHDSCAASGMPDLDGLSDMQANVANYLPSEAIESLERFGGLSGLSGTLILMCW